VHQPDRLLGGPAARFGDPGDPDPDVGAQCVLAFFS